MISFCRLNLSNYFTLKLITGNNQKIDIYYSTFQSSFRIFGGLFIWAFARFSKTFNNLASHHSFNKAFIVIFGTQFQVDGDANQEFMIPDNQAKYFQSFQHSLPLMLLKL